MKLTPDDPRLTAYALGELDATERAEIEAALKHSPECRQVVEEIQQLGGMLEKEFAQEVGVGLREEQRGVVMAGVAGATETRRAGALRSEEAAGARKIIPFPSRRGVIMGIAA